VSEAEAPADDNPPQQGRNADIQDQIPSGHAFISYVHEDGEVIDRIQKALSAAGITVWRDRDWLLPGDDWQLKIREAITTGALAFIACFSENSVARDTTFQHEELNLAVEQLRLRPPDRPWFIPVRLTDCELPAYNIGPARTLDTWHRVDLFRDWDTGIAQLIAGVVRIFPDAFLRPVEPNPVVIEERPSEASGDSMGGSGETDDLADPVQVVKRWLPRPESSIELHDLVMAETQKAHSLLVDPQQFPADHASVTDDVAGLRFMVEQADHYRERLVPYLPTLMALATWRRNDEQSRLLTDAVERLANLEGLHGGKTALIEMRRYPGMVTAYACGFAAVHKRNFASLKAVTVDARFRELNGTIPLIGAIHPGSVFGFNLTAQVLALESAEGRKLTDDELAAMREGRAGKRYTPVSDHLCDLLRPLTAGSVLDTQDHDETFDQLEVLLALIADDVKASLKRIGAYSPGAWYGSFGWRGRHSDRPPVERRLFEEFEVAGDSWPPLQAGLFGGSAERASEAFERFLPQVEQARGRMW
jgi:hypothetical protein